MNFPLILLLINNNVKLFSRWLVIVDLRYVFTRLIVEMLLSGREIQKLLKHVQLFLFVLRHKSTFFHFAKQFMTIKFIKKSVLPNRS